MVWLLIGIGIILVFCGLAIVSEGKEEGNVGWQGVLIISLVWIGMVLLYKL